MVRHVQWLPSHQSTRAAPDGRPKLLSEHFLSTIQVVTEFASDSRAECDEIVVLRGKMTKDAQVVA
jgi:hypothetical protein